MKELDIAVIGIGLMGFKHAKALFEKKVKGARLAAVCDLSPSNLTKAKETWGDQIEYFDHIESFFQKAKVDGVIVATPHLFHPELGIKGLKAGMNILIEKPMGVHTKQVHELNVLAEKSNKVFSAMLNQRTRPIYIRAKELIRHNSLGDLKRIQWTITDWYRTQAYYDSGSWRATWAGEGGGVLLNQCPHNLDLFQWFGGMPARVRSFCSFGKYHQIEVEDDVTAYFEYPNGATGTFIASTGEYPGTNRLEIIGDKGKMVIEDETLTLWQNKQSEREWNKQNKEIWASPGKEKTVETFTSPESDHLLIIQNWVNAILKGEALVAPGLEGIHSLRLANAILLSTWKDSWVDLQFDDDEYYEYLQQKIEYSALRK